MTRSVHRSRRTLSVAFLIATLATIALMGSAEAAPTTPFGTNLVKNPGAEARGGGPKTCVDFAGIPKWDCEGHFKVVRYGAPGFPGKGASAAIGGGSSLFFSGPYDTTFDRCGDLHQNIRIYGRAGAIDSGQVKITLSGYVRTRNSDAYTLEVFFEDSDNNGIGADPLGWEQYVASGANFVKVSATRKVPASTRFLDVYVAGVSLDTVNCQAFFDNISVKLKPA